MRTPIFSQLPIELTYIIFDFVNGTPKQNKDKVIDELKTHNFYEYDYWNANEYYYFGAPCFERLSVIVQTKK